MRSAALRRPMLPETAEPLPARRQRHRQLRCHLCAHDGTGFVLIEIDCEHEAEDLCAQMGLEFVAVWREAGCD